MDRKLKRLNLGGNELTSVPQKSIGILDFLRKLEIQENKIRTINDGDFEGTTYLNYSIIKKYVLFKIIIHNSLQRIEQFGLANLGAQFADASTCWSVSTSHPAEFARARRQPDHLH